MHELSEANAIIFAPTTPAGASGVAVFRLSGQLLAPVIEGLRLTSTLPARTAKLCSIYHPQTHTLIDQAIAIYFPGPRSFTGEDVLELHTHGGSAIRIAMLDALSALPGCRLAEPGEFSKRAFMNGKMDLLQAEGIADMIAAQTPAQHQLALRQFGGQASARFEALRGKALHSLALLEAYLDFPDEEIPDETLEQVNAEVCALRNEAQTLLKASPCGELIRDGFRIAIVGPPNAGKSSLMNRLTQRDVAITSELPGTTRDRIEVDLNLHGYLVRLIDTAGLRETKDVIEAEGIRRSREAASNADLTILVLDIITDTELLPDLLKELPEATLILLNKCDVSNAPLNAELKKHNPLLVSAMEGDGIDTLLEKLREHIDQCLSLTEAPPTLTRARHREALTDALNYLSDWNTQKPLELLAEDLRGAATAIGKITGKISVDQLLDVVFREFCIGK